MNKVTIKHVPFKLAGELIEKGAKLNFKAIDRKGKERSSSELTGKYIISVFPDIETSVCDAQTQEIAKLASQNPNTHFLSVTTDSVEKINKWCAAHGIDNVDIWSDQNLEFANATNALITKIKKLTRGILIMDGDTIVDLSFKEEVTEMPDFELIEKFLK